MGTSEGARKGWTDESRAKRAEAMRRKWADPEYRARRAKKEADPETKSRRSEAAIKSNSDPLKRLKQSQTMLEKWRTDDAFRDRQSAGLRRLMEDPTQRQSRSESVKRAWKEDRSRFTRSLEALQKSWDNENWRARRASAMLKILSDSPVTENEKIVGMALTALGVPFTVHDVSVSRELDIYIPSLGINIEVDGCNHLGDSSRSRDKERDEYIRSMGIEVVRISHQSIRDGSFIAKLADTLSGHLSDT